MPYNRIKSLSKIYLVHHHSNHVEDLFCLWNRYLLCDGVLRLVPLFVVFFYSLDMTGKPLSLEKGVTSGIVKHKTASASICSEGMGSSESTTAQLFSMSSDPVTIIEQRVQEDDTSVPIKQRVPDNDDGSHSQ